MTSDSRTEESKRGKWTKLEDENLRLAVEAFGEKKWTRISERVPTRTPLQCLHRWMKILKPGLVKGPWSSQEDEQLRDWVQRFGPTNWSQCAESIAGRSGKQCRERWDNALNPALKKGEWTEQEDELILKNFEEKGAKWTEIAQLLPGRSVNSIKNRFYSTLRRSQTAPLGDAKAPNVAHEQLMKLMLQLRQLEVLLFETRAQIGCLEARIDNEATEDECQQVVKSG